MKKGRLLNNNKEYGWNSKALQYAKNILDKYVMIAVGSTVTEAFVETSKTVINGTEKMDLPFINDHIDSKSKTGGHMDGLLVPNPIAKKWIQNSNKKLTTPFTGIFHGVGYYKARLFYLFKN